MSEKLSVKDIEIISGMLRIPLSIADDSLYTMIAISYPENIVTDREIGKNFAADVTTKRGLKILCKFWRDQGNACYRIRCNACCCHIKGTFEKLSNTVTVDGIPLCGKPDLKEHGPQ